MHTLFPLGLSGMPASKLRFLAILAFIAAVNCALFFVYALAVGVAIKLVF